MDKYKLIYVLVFCLLCLNFIADHFTKIYPSVVFPSFSGAPSMAKGAALRSPEIYGITGSGSLVMLNEKVLFSDLYTKHTDFLLQRLQRRMAAGELSPKDPQLRGYFVRRLAELGKPFKGVRIVITKPVYSLVRENLKNNGENDDIVNIYF